MGRRSIMLLMTLAVLLQPSLASVCTAACPMSPMPTQKAHALSMSMDSMHQHHHAAMTEPLSSSFASGACQKQMDLRTTAVLSPTVTQVFAARNAPALEAPAGSTSSSLPVVISGIRFKPPIVVPLRI